MSKNPELTKFKWGRSALQETLRKKDLGNTDVF